MREMEHLSTLIGDIYDAALDPSLWSGGLEGAAKFVGGAAASLYSRDLAGTTANITYQHGLDPGYVQLYTQTYVKRVPALGYFVADVEEPLSTADIIPYEAFVETRFYKEWAKPQGLVDSLHALLDKSGTSARRSWSFSTFATASSTMKQDGACGSSCPTFAAPR